MGPASRSRHALYESFVFCDVVTHPRAQILPRALCWRPLSLSTKGPIRRTHTGQTTPPAISATRPVRAIGTVTGMVGKHDEVSVVPR